MENEIMNYEETGMETEIDVIETEEAKSGIGTGAAMAIGAGLTFAAFAAVKLGKKLWRKYGPKKGAQQVDEDDLVDVSDEEIVDDNQK